MKTVKNLVASSTCGALLVLGTAVLLSIGFSAPASATAQFAKDTGMACAACHVAPAGGGPLTPLGVKFQANGNKVPK